MNDFWEENKKKIITVGIIVGITIVIAIINLVVFKSEDFNSIRELRFREFGTLYYKNLIYPLYESDIEEYKDSGFKVTLYDIATSLDKEEYNIYEIFSDGRKTCNLLSSYLMIYPIENYDDESIKIEITLSCDLDIDKAGNYE